MHETSLPTVYKRWLLLIGIDILRNYKALQSLHIPSMDPIGPASMNICIHSELHTSNMFLALSIILSWMYRHVSVPARVSVNMFFCLFLVVCAHSACMYARARVCVFIVFMFLCLFVFMFVCVCVCVCVYVCVCVCVFVCVCMCVCVFVCLFARLSACWFACSACLLACMLCLSLRVCACECYTYVGMLPSKLFKIHCSCL
jgi:hypothetical protein